MPGTPLSELKMRRSSHEDRESEISGINEENETDREVHDDAERLLTS